jgi:hypothetical protein
MVTDETPKVARALGVDHIVSAPTQARLAAAFWWASTPV